MKKFAGMFMVVAFTSVSAFGGTVEFMNPSSGGSVLEIDRDGGSGTYEVHITSSSNDPFNSADIIFATNDLLFDFGAWAFSGEFTAATTIQGLQDTPGQVPGARDELQVGGVNFAGNVVPIPIMVGTLTIIAPGGLVPGTYSVFVDAELETNGVSKTSALGFAPDPLFGMGTVVVTPEPTTLVLLGVGAVVALRRRRQLA